MNNKAQVGNYAVAFMLAIVIIIIGVSLAHPVNEVTTMAMNETSSIGGMNCTSTTDDFMKAGCWTMDIGQAFFIGSLIALAGVIISARIIFQ